MRGFSAAAFVVVTGLLGTCAGQPYNPADPGSADFWLLQAGRPVPAQPPSAVVEVLKPMFLFGTTTTPSGDLLTAGGGGTARAGADNLCVARRAALTLSPDNSCTSVRALVSFIAADQLTNMPANFSVPINRFVRGPTGIEVADNYADMINPAINLKSTLVAANVLAGATFWSHSINTGAVSGSSCTGGTTTTGTGQRGATNTVTSAWLDTGGPVGCTVPEPILCICF